MRVDHHESMRKVKIAIALLLICISSFVLLQVLAGHEGVENPLNAAWTQFDARNYQKCVEYGKKAAKKEPSKPDAHFIMGRCEERLGNFEVSYQHFVHVCEIDPEYQDAYNNRAIQSLKLFNKKRFQMDLIDWKQRFPEDGRIAQIKNQFELVLEEQKKEGYTDDEARQTIKMNYLQSLMSIK